ncbi:MAG: phosphoenolpyruvate carboxykinase (GTP) [Phycisphaerae bacterium]|jgi:phosphoenolpyruvate carboxykinase (GTP)
MQEKFAKVLKGKMDADSFAKLSALDNDRLHAFVAEAVELCQPATVKVCSDDKADIEYIRRQAVANNEETPLALAGHTVHFDNYPGDQGRDKEVTRYLVPAGESLGKNLNTIDRETGRNEVRGLLTGAMKGRQMYVRFFCLGPTGSPFAISCVQITDSAYVCHSEDLLYRAGYEQFKTLGGSGDYFRFLHSAGRLVNNVSAEMDKKRIYIDYRDELIYSVNTQYAGNTVGLKKLALRLAIRKADREGWLAEHMFIMGVHGPGGRVTYFTGAYPSACGKTSTAMIPGETIIGDDLAYFRAINGEARAVNTEVGIFGIISDVNAKGDPVIHKVLTSPGEVIFSNVLVNNGKCWWYGNGEETPKEGVNYVGAWHVGKIDMQGNEIPPANKGNARYTITLRSLANLDPQLDNPQGVNVGGIIYGGRDSDTSVPVQQAFDWTHGIVAYGASLESETTAATLGATGVRSFNLMSNLDFLAIPIGKYITNNLNFAKGLKKAPAVFSSNYFLKDSDGKYLNGIRDKAVWVKWMELRAHGEVEVLTAPTGLIPKYEDLKKLFKQCLGQDYTQAQYVQQFTIRIPENLAKLDRIMRIYRQDIDDTPAVVLEVLEAQKKRLEAMRAQKGDYVSPLDL